MKFISRPLMAVLAAAICSLGVHPAQADTWPTRPITMVVGFAAGAGPADIVGRIFAEYASKQLGQPIIGENKPGGGGIVGAIAASKAAPDGYTILFHALGPMILRPILDPSVGYDPVKDFSPIALAVDVPTVIISGQKFASQSLVEMVDFAKKNPGMLTVGHSGLGTMGHLAALLHASNAGMRNNYIGYRNGTEMITDILGGRIDVAYGAYIPPFKQAHILAVMTAERVEFLPDVPSIA